MAKEKREVKRLSGSIPVELYDRIKAYADKIGVSVSGAIAMICDMWLRSQDVSQLVAEVQGFRTTFEQSQIGK